MFILCYDLDPEFGSVDLTAMIRRAVGHQTNSSSAYFYVELIFPEPQRITKPHQSLIIVYYRMPASGKFAQRNSWRPNTAPPTTTTAVVEAAIWTTGGPRMAAVSSTPPPRCPLATFPWSPCPIRGSTCSTGRVRWGQPSARPPVMSTSWRLPEDLLWVR